MFQTVKKIRLIKNNLARKNVDFLTKKRCYEALKILYGILKRDNPRNSSGKFTIASIDATGSLSQKAIAKEVGFSVATMERADKNEKSDLPKIIKDSTFKGRLAIYPVAELLRESDEVKKRVIEKTIKKLDV